VLYIVSYPWFFFASFVGAYTLGPAIVNATSGPSPDMSRIFYGYGTGLFTGGIIGGMVLGSLLGLLCTGMVREILGKKIWQRGKHNAWGTFAGLILGVFYSIIFIQVNIINADMMPLGRYLTQNQAAKRIRGFCLPKNLPEKVDSTPIFYKAGDPSIPDVGVLYQNIETSERAFIIIMDDVSDTYSDDDAHYLIGYCENKVFLTSDLQACYHDLATHSTYRGSRDDIVEGPPLITELNWLIREDKKVTIYSILSPFALEETKAIAASICAE